MASHSPRVIVCLLVTLFVAFIVDGTDTRYFVKSVNRRSYDSRRKNKDDPSNNVLKTHNTQQNVFITYNNTVVVAQTGGTAVLPCVVRKSNTGVVSWIRRKDYRLLTVGLTTYISDNRFMVEHVRHLQNWGLLIKPVRTSDAGLYECQVSLHPPSSTFVELKVTKAVADILGSPDLHLNTGSTLRLVCTLRHSTEPPVYVFWFHEQKMINYDPGVTVFADRSSSILMVNDVDKSHNGNYTCSPSNAVPASIYVHVLNATTEEQPAAMQHANTSMSSSNCKVYSGCLFLPFLMVIIDGKGLR